MHSELSRKGWERLQPPEHWGALVEDAKQRILRIPGEKGDTADAALRHFHLRKPAQVPRSLAGLRACEIGDLLRNYERAWRANGGEIAPADPKQLHWLFCTFTLDPRKRDVLDFSKDLEEPPYGGPRRRPGALPTFR